MGIIIDSYKFEQPELYTEANVLSINDEANSLTGISEVGAGTLTAESSGAQVGTYYAKLVSSGGSSERIQVTWSGLENGESYKFSFWARKVTFNAYVALWTNVQQIGGGTADPNIGGGSYFITSDTWSYHEFDLETTDTTGIARFYCSNSGVSEVHVDGFSIKKIV